MLMSSCVKYLHLPLLTPALLLISSLAQEWEIDVLRSLRVFDRKHQLDLNPVLRETFHEVLPRANVSLTNEATAQLLLAGRKVDTHFENLLELRPEVHNKGKPATAIQTTYSHSLTLSHTHSCTC